MSAGNKIGADGARAIAETLYENGTLRYLDLSGMRCCVILI